MEANKGLYEQLLKQHANDRSSATIQIEKINPFFFFSLSFFNAGIFCCHDQPSASFDFGFVVSVMLVVFLLAAGPASYLFESRSTLPLSFQPLCTVTRGRCTVPPKAVPHFVAF
jgi:hypothetical protein